MSADRSSVAAVPIDAADPADAAAPTPLPARPRSTAGHSPTITPSVIARVIGVSVDGSSVIVTIAAGSSSGVRGDWQCQLVNNSGPASGLDCVILRVDKALTVARTKLLDQIRGYSRALLAPPP
jgi:hypothetical protein